MTCQDDRSCVTNQCVSLQTHECRQCRVGFQSDRHPGHLFALRYQVPTSLSSNWRAVQGIRHGMRYRSGSRQISLSSQVKTYSPNASRPKKSNVTLRATNSFASICFELSISPEAHSCRARANHFIIMHRSGLSTLRRLRGGFNRTTCTRYLPIVPSLGNEIIFCILWFMVSTMNVPVHLLHDCSLVPTTFDQRSNGFPF